VISSKLERSYNTATVVGNSLASPSDPNNWTDLALVWKFPSNLECSDEEVLTIFS
jgi:hypothetical protein